MYKESEERRREGEQYGYHNGNQLLLLLCWYIQMSS